MFWTLGMRCAIYNPCQQRCVDTDQGVRCQCNSGYTLASDDRSCQGRNDLPDAVTILTSDGLRVMSPESTICLLI